MVLNRWLTILGKPTTVYKYTILHRIRLHTHSFMNSELGISMTLQQKVPLQLLNFTET